ncbi:hypothetical protein BDV93DRAFT_558700 [Ceratobasidium sp. AG-I]|nr:hypothetical protein BDV93DRAFT_558700 [Ceratobasidium sp. AG-I]
MATIANSVFDEPTLTKVAEAFNTADPNTLTAVENNDQDGQKLAEDMYQVYINFRSSSTQLGNVDSDYGSNWKGQWNPLSDRYRTKLEQAQSIAVRGETYINGTTILPQASFFDCYAVTEFNKTVADKFSSDASNVANDTKLLKEWLDANDDDRGLKLESQQISQGFLDLSNEVTALQSSFNTFAAQKGATYQSDLDQMQRDVKNLQDRITWEDSAAAEAQRTADGLVGTLAAIGGIFETIFTFGQSSSTSCSLFGSLPRIYLELRREKDRLAAKAQQLAKDKSHLHGVQNALSVLAQDVIDVSGRLGQFATLWSVAHSNILELRALLDTASTTHSATFFRLRVKVIASSSAVFAKDMKRFSDALGDIGNVQSHRAYELSPQFGGSDVTRGILFNDARDLDIDFDRPIVKVIVTSGWVVDGIKITYRLRNGSTQTVAHGTTGYNNDVTLTLNDNEYISAATGKSGHAGNGEPWMGDCVQQLELRITNSVTGAQRTYGPRGTAQGLSADSTTMIPWSGRLIAFAGSADNNAGQVGLRGISFVKKAT